MNTLAKVLGVVAVTAIFAWFLKYGIGIENMKESGWVLVLILYAGVLGAISEL